MAYDNHVSPMLNIYLAKPEIAKSASKAKVKICETVSRDDDSSLSDENASNEGSVVDDTTVIVKSVLSLYF